ALAAAGARFGRRYISCRRTGAIGLACMAATPRKRYVISLPYIIRPPVFPFDERRVPIDKRLDGYSPPCRARRRRHRISPATPNPNRPTIPGSGTGTAPPLDPPPPGAPPV